MASIGFLGFCVWSQTMAFQWLMSLIINITVCWNNLLICIFNTEIYWILINILITFYSSNINILIQSARNLAIKNIKNIIFYNKGSSETICNSTYDLFYKEYELYNKQNIVNITPYFLDWFIGFIEGDGAILHRKNYDSQNNFINERNMLIIVQKDYKVLEYIKDTLLIGNINYVYDDKKNIKHARYTVYDQNEIKLIYLILNGNLHLKKRIVQLNNWYRIFTDRKILVPHIIKTERNFSLENAWLSGFTDAEGCFSIKIYKNHNKLYVKALFILDQKGEMEILNKISLSLFNKNLAKVRNLKSTISNIKLEDLMYRIEISCNSSINNKKVLDYFNKYELKTTKYFSFKIFKEILDIFINKQPLSEIELKKVRYLRSIMNLHNIENSPIQHSSKS